MTGALTARRHWGAFNTPWVVRKLRKRAAPDTSLPEAYRFSGSAEDADGWMSRLIANTDTFEHLRNPRLRRPIEAPDLLEMLKIPAELPSGGEFHLGGGSGGGGVDAGWFDGVDDLAMVIFAVVAVVIVLAVAVPLGLVAIEFVVTLALIAVGVVARVAHIKPWTVLVLRDGTVVAAVAVKGWRPSRAVIRAVRSHNG